MQRGKAPWERLLSLLSPRSGVKRQQRESPTSTVLKGFAANYHAVLFPGGLTHVERCFAGLIADAGVEVLGLLLLPCCKLQKQMRQSSIAYVLLTLFGRQSQDAVR